MSLFSNVKLKPSGSVLGEIKKSCGYAETHKRMVTPLQQFIAFGFIHVGEYTGQVLSNRLY